MSRRSTRLLKAALAAMHYSGADSLLAPMMRGRGVIFMLHQVNPDPVRAFEPNRILRVTPDFLEEVIVSVRAAGFDVIALDEVRERLAGAHDRPFACFTLDDGYRDNRDFAYPVFKRHDVPFTIYVSSDFADGRGDFWWLTLEDVVRSAHQLTLAIHGEGRYFPLRTVGEKEAAYHEIYWWLRSIPEDLARAAVHEIAEANGIDTDAAHRELTMTWPELRALAQDPLVTIGAHTTSHCALGKLSEADARKEMAESIWRIETELGVACRHFSYPYGSECCAREREFRIAEELGLETAVTTRKGLIHPEHAATPMALPRLSLNGDFQDTRYIRALLSGVPFAVLNGLKRIASPAA